MIRKQPCYFARGFRRISVTLPYRIRFHFMNTKRYIQNNISKNCHCNFHFYRNRLELK